MAKIKQRNPERNKAKKQSTENGRLRNNPRITVGWGRGASEYRPGIFTKRYFVKHGEACCADIYSALAEEIDHLNEERIRIGEKPLRRPNYSSFARYFHWFLILGLIERTDRRESAIYDHLQKRVFYRLTLKGKHEDKAWQDPLSAVHPEFR